MEAKRKSFTNFIIEKVKEGKAVYERREWEIYKARIENNEIVRWIEEYGGVCSFFDTLTPVHVHTVRGKRHEIFVLSNEEKIIYQALKSNSLACNAFSTKDKWKGIKALYKILKNIEEDGFLHYPQGLIERLTLFSLTDDIKLVRDILLSYLIETKKEEIKATIIALSLSNEKFSEAYTKIQARIRGEREKLEVFKSFFSNS